MRKDKKRLNKDKTIIRKRERFAKSNRVYANEIIMCMNTEKVLQ